MITRIVKLHFQEKHTADFMSYFDSISHVVNEFPGCHGMRLYRSVDDHNVVFTYSHWDHIEALNNYRDSEAFQTIWPKIKPWFAYRPEAWTVERLFDGFEFHRDNR
jgi:quinol monooxygenase YgiN